MKNRLHESSTKAHTLEILALTALFCANVAQSAETFKPSVILREPTTYRFVGKDGKSYNIPVERVDGALIHQGDILIQPKNAVQNAVGRTPFLRWDDGIIPYYIEPNHPYRAQINSAIDTLNRNTVLWFKPTTNFGSDYVSIRHGNDGCYSGVGTPVFGDATDVFLGPGCGSLGIITHELLHAAGLWHEQSRSDRDLYVKVHLDNVKSDKQNNFDIEDGWFSKDIGKYNFDSVMHYACKDFAIDNSKFTIESISGTHPIGQRTGLSQGDVDAIRAMYYNVSPTRGKPPTQSTPLQSLVFPRACYHQADPSSPLDWIDNVRVPGQQSKSSPSVAEFNGKLHMVHLGNSSNDIWYSVFDGSSWTPNVKIANQKSKLPPSLAVFGGKLHMVHLGDSSNDIWQSTFDGANWTPNVKIPNQQSKASPAIAAHGGRLHMVHLGNSSNDIWHSTFNGVSWTPNVKITGQQSKASPALYAFNGRLHMVHIGDSSNNIWHSQFDGTSWTPNARINGQESKNSPALTAYKGRLHMMHSGDSTNDIWTSIFDGTTWTPNTRLPHQQSKASASIASFSGHLFIVHIGDTSNDIWFSRSND